jgi:peptidyl-prolyl cis-trans isomerase B (cyclophilin B)
VARKTVKAEPQLPTFEILFENSFVLTGELYPGLAPNAVGNFVHLANSGFYDGSVICLVSPGKTIVIDHLEKTVPYYIEAECELNGCDYNVGKVCAGSVCFFHSTQYNSGNSAFFIVLTNDSRTVRMVQGAYALFGQVLEGLQMAEMLSCTGNDENGVPRIYHRIKTIRVETHGRQFPFETCAEPENTIGKVILNPEDDADLSSEMQA